MSTQTDSAVAMVLNVNVSTQTDIIDSSKCTSTFTQTDAHSIQQNEMCDATKEKELIKCEGNSDDKFLPLAKEYLRMLQVLINS